MWSLSCKTIECGPEISEEKLGSVVQLMHKVLNWQGLRCMKLACGEQNLKMLLINSSGSFKIVGATTW